MDIDELLTNPKIWRGQIARREAALASGFEELDACLPGGGWPQGALIEVFTDHYGSGELALFMPLLAHMSQKPLSEKGWVVWVAPPFIPYAPALIQRGIKLEKLLWVRVHRASEDARWALEQCLRAAACGLALAWLRSIPLNTLRRLQLNAEENRSLVVIFRPLDALRQHSPAVLRLKLRTERSGTSIDILKCRGRSPARVHLRAGFPFPGHRPGDAEWR
jgi:hypothetical protein